MEEHSRNLIIGSLSAIPAYLSAGVLCLVGLTKTTDELSDQTMWFIYTVPALLAVSLFVWCFNIRKVRLDIVDLGGALFFVWLLASCRINGNIVESQLWEMCFLAVTYLSLRIIVSSYRHIGKWLFFVICACGVAEAVMGIQQGFGIRYSNHHLFNVTGTFLNPGPYGGYIAIILSLALGYMIPRYRYTSKIFTGFRHTSGITVRRILWALLFIAAVCTVVSIVVILPSTMSRAAFVAAGMCVIAIVLNNRRVYIPITNYVRSNKGRSLIIGSASLLVICGGTYGIYAIKKDSADGRLLMWEISAKVMMNNPVAGVGPGYFRGAFGDTQAEYFRSGERSETEMKIAGCPEYGFNEYLQTGAETGVTGLLLFLFLVISALWKLFRAGSYYAYGLLALLVFAFFSYPFSILPIKILFVLFLAVSGSCTLKKRNAIVVEKIVVGAMLAGCIPVVALTARPYIERIEATKQWQELRRWYSMEFYSCVLEDYPKLFPLLKDNPAFLFEYGRALHMDGQYRASLDVLIPATRLSADPMYYNVIGNNFNALGGYDKAADAYLKAYYIVPHRMYPLYLLGKMHSDTGDMVNAELYAGKVVRMTPKVESPATRDMQREMKEILDNINSDEK